MKFFRVTYAIGIAVLVGIIGFSIWRMQNSPWFLALGYLGMGVSALLLVLAAINGLIFTARFWFESQVIAVEQWGAYLKRFNKVTPLPPLLPAQPKVAGTTVTEVKPDVPRLGELIAAGTLVSEEDGQSVMLRGFRADGTARYGAWPGVVAIIGMQNVGKTITMVMLIIIALLQGARVVVCDTHHTKGRSLYKKIMGLERFVTFALTEADVLRETQRLRAELQARKMGSKPYPYVLFYDELCSLIRARQVEELKEEIPATMEEVSQEGHGYNLHMVAAIHDVSNGGIGDARLRGFWNFVYSHKLSSDQSKFIEAFRGKYGKQKASMVIGGLPAGHTMVRDEVNEIEYLIIPNGDSRDALLARKKLEEMGRELAEPEAFTRAEPQKFLPEPEAFTRAEPEAFNDSSHSNLPPEREQFTSLEKKQRAEIRRLIASTRMNETEIICYVFQCTKGGSDEYKRGRAIFKDVQKHMFDELEPMEELRSLNHMQQEEKQDQQNDP